MAQKKPASHSGAKKRKKPDTAAKRAVEREPTQIPVRQILAGACFLLAVLALFACLGFQGFILAGVKSLLGGLVGKMGFYLSRFCSDISLFCCCPDTVARWGCAAWPPACVW